MDWYTLSGFMLLKLVLSTCLMGYTWLLCRLGLFWQAMRKPFNFPVSSQLRPPNKKSQDSSLYNVKKTTVYSQNTSTKVMKHKMVRNNAQSCQSFMFSLVFANILTQIKTNTVRNYVSFFIYSVVSVNLKFEYCCRQLYLDLKTEGFWVERGQDCNLECLNWREVHKPSGTTPECTVHTVFSSWFKFHNYSIYNWTPLFWSLWKTKNSLIN